MAHHPPATSPLFPAKAVAERFAAVVLVLLSVALLVLFVRQRRELRESGGKLFSLTTVPQSPDDLAREITTVSADQAAEDRELAALNARLALVPPELLANPRPLTKAERGQINESLIFTHPDLATVRHRNDRRMVQRNFGDLLGEVELPATELERLKELLVETLPFRPENPATVARSREIVEQEIRGILNDESFQTYRDIQETGNRTFVEPSLLGLRLADEGIPLAPRQARQIALIEKDIPAEQRISGASDSVMRERIYERAGTVLTSEQLRSLREMDAERDADH